MIFINLDSFQLTSVETERGKEMGEWVDIRFRRPGYGGFSWGQKVTKLKWEK